MKHEILIAIRENDRRWNTEMSMLAKCMRRDENDVIAELRKINEERNELLKQLEAL